MSIILTSDKAVEKSTFIITASFTDENGDAVIPNSIKWTLSDSSGDIMNSREDIEILTPAATVTIVLSGLDLAIIDTDLNRFLAIEAEYDSALGSDLPLNEELQFKIRPLVNIS